MLTFRRAVPLVAALVFVTCSALARRVHAQDRVLPANAHTSYDSRGWECDDGFVRRKATCVAAAAATDTEIRQHLVERSIAGYSGSCPCPYFVDRAGRKCGLRSAYSRPGGESPLCYPHDVSADEVSAFRRSASDTTVARGRVDRAA